MSRGSRGEGPRLEGKNGERAIMGESKGISNSEGWQHRRSVELAQ